MIDVTDPAFTGLAGRDLVREGLASEADGRRAAAFTNPAAGASLLARRAALRIVLAGYLECAPVDVRLVTAPGGKPVLLPLVGDRESPTVALSVGHSGDMYCIAVCASDSVGCDVERLREIPRARAIATRWFGADEAARLDSIPKSELVSAFMELWTGKDALAKRHGAGLRLMKGQGDDAEVREELDVRRERAARRLRSFAPAIGYAGAVASSEAIEDVEIHRPTEDAWII
jgi:phosphopantetheinyl transferase